MLRGAQRRVVPCLSFGKSKQLTLFGPIDGDLERQSHQLLRRELRRVLAVDDGSDDIGRQRRKSSGSNIQVAPVVARLQKSLTDMRCNDGVVTLSEIGPV